MQWKPSWRRFIFTMSSAGLRGPPEADGAFSLHYDESTPAEYCAAAPADQQNLVVRAVEALATAAGLAPWGQMKLLKRIPPQAGLGGGSSDAAAALVLANAAWGLNYSPPRLAELAAELGSDVPFFLAGESAVCRGRGERVDPVAAMPRLDVVVVKPPAGIDTAAAYRGASLPGQFPWMPSTPPAADWGIWSPPFAVAPLAQAGRLMTNRLQDAAAGLCHGIDEIGAVFDRLSCYGRQMTGSGSACFGVMRSARHARWAAGLLSSWNLGTVFATATRR